MKKYIRNLLYLIFLITILTLPYFVFAESAALNKLQAVGTNSGYMRDTNEFTVADIAGTGVKVFSSLLSIIFIILMLYGGFNWMMAAGDNAKVEKAKDTIRRAVIGLIIIVGAYAIWAFVWGKLAS